MSALRVNDYRTGAVTLVPLDVEPVIEPTGPISRRWLTKAEVAALDDSAPGLPIRGIYTDAERIARQIVREATA